MKPTVGMLRKRILLGTMFFALGTLAVAQTGKPQDSLAGARAAKPLPTIVEKDGRYALLVDGEPYLMLGMQANNSSAWPAYFDKVWPAAEALHANTVELPIYWEQLEATEGKFDFSVLDLMLKQAREAHVRLVLLWFGTWKNGSSHYTPEWIKLNQEKYPFLQNEKGVTVDSPSPFSPARLQADKEAFRALMRHLKETDAQRTVLMVQVENEAGVWGGVRDYGIEAQKAFAGAVPEKLAAGLGKQKGTWREVFGDDADETFEAWYTATYIEEVAAAGKREYPLPLYVNAALRDPFHPGRAPNYESGAPTDNNIELWKIAAPSISVVAPDIYLPEYAKYMKVMELYKRKDNPLLIPETGNTAVFARYVFAAIGEGTIGWAPFGLDYSRYSNQTEGPEAMEATALKPFAQHYALLAPIARLLAKGNLEGKVRGTSEDPENHTQRLDFERWQAVVSYGLPSFGNWMQPKGNTPPDGGVVILELGPDEFLVAGHHARVDFTPTFAPGKKRLWLRVEEGSYDAAGNWKMARIWNGDQTDYGLNLKSDENVLLKVSLTTY
jgi:beta-galactosidase GanA